MENIDQNSSKTKELVKKYLPVSALILLTVILMIFFRYKKGDIGRFLEKGKENLIAFYANNLQPLFATTDITNEDVFNFALYQTLPIDKEKNKVLTVSDQGGNNQVYEIKPALYNPKTDNYEKFVEYLELDDREKEQADSILNIYKKEIYVSILTNNKNTVAVSSKIGELQKAVLADLLTFAYKVNSKKAWELFPNQNNFGNDVKNFVVSTKDIPQNEFLFITPDTAFQTVCSVNSEDLESKLDEKLEIADHTLPDIPEPPTNWNFNFQIKDGKSKGKKDYSHPSVQIHRPDSNIFKVVIPIPEVAFETNFDNNVRIKLDQAAEKIRQLSIVFGNKSKQFQKAKVHGSQIPATEDDIELYFQNPIEIVEQTMEMLSKQDFSNWEDFGEKMDSFARSFAAGYSDSIIINNKAALETLKASRKNKVKPPKVPKNSVNDN